MSVTIAASWKSRLMPEFEKPYFKNIKTAILYQKSKGKTIFPPSHLIFNAFEHTPFESVKVVILGQDPYHGEGQAMGLSFSVPRGINIPPSLQNIFKELKADIPDFVEPSSGDLTKWASQGVLLLNAFLTVNKNEPASHQKFGWEVFTNEVIRTISSQREAVVFLLWGNFAQQKRELIDTKKHLVLTAAHPSPFSAHKGFLGCRHFSKTNDYLKANGKTCINW
jgi:uracil-DNA glycosylase